MTAVGEGELLTKVNVPPSSGAGDGFAGLTIGAHGTYVVNAAATVSGDGARIAIGCVAADAGARDRDGGAARRRATSPRTRFARPRTGSARRSTRPPTSTARPTSGVISPRSRPCAPSCRRPRGGRSSGGARVTSRDGLGRGQRRADRARGACAPPPRPLPPRRPRAHGDARRLRHRELRRLHRAPERRAREELHAARRPGGRREDHDGRGPRRRR